MNRELPSTTRISVFLEISSSSLQVSGPAFSPKIELRTGAKPPDKSSRNFQRQYLQLQPSRIPSGKSHLFLTIHAAKRSRPSLLRHRSNRLLEKPPRPPPRVYRPANHIASSRATRKQQVGTVVIVRRQRHAPQNHGKARLTSNFSPVKTLTGWIFHLTFDVLYILFHVLYPLPPAHG